MKKVTIIRKVLSYAKYMSEQQMENLIERILHSEIGSNGYRLDEIISNELQKNETSGRFVKQWLRDQATKNVYLHPDISVGMKEYFIDTALENLLDEDWTETMEVNFEHMDRRLSSIMNDFLNFCKA